MDVDEEIIDDSLPFELDLLRQDIQDFITFSMSPNDIIQPAIVGSESSEVITPTHNEDLKSTDNRVDSQDGYVEELDHLQVDNCTSFMEDITTPQPPVEDTTMPQQLADKAADQSVLKTPSKRKMSGTPVDTDAAIKKPRMDPEDLSDSDKKPAAKVINPYMTQTKMGGKVLKKPATSKVCSQSKILDDQDS